jgi:hypothetical protein
VDLIGKSHEQIARAHLHAACEHRLALKSTRIGGKRERERERERERGSRKHASIFFSCLLPRIRRAHKDHGRTSSLTLGPFRQYHGSMLSESIDAPSRGWYCACSQGVCAQISPVVERGREERTRRREAPGGGRSACVQERR